MSKSKKESTHAKLADSERAHFLEQGNVTGCPRKGGRIPLIHSLIKCFEAHGKLGAVK